MQQAEQQRIQVLKQQQVEEDRRKKLQATAIDFRGAVVTVDASGMVVRTEQRARSSSTRPDYRRLNPKTTVRCALCKPRQYMPSLWGIRARDLWRQETR